MSDTPGDVIGREGKRIDVLVYGLGAIGSFYAFLLSRSPNVRLSVCARSNYDAVAANGILIQSENHGEHRFHPHAVYRSPKEARDVGRETGYDFILVANKAVNLLGTVEDLKPVVQDEGNSTCIVIMQNGVGNEDPFQNAFPRCTIISGVIWVGATQTSPGVTKQHISESTTLGLFSPGNSTNPNFSDAQQQAFTIFTNLLTHAKHPFITSDTIQTPRWKKCIWNAAWNSLTTLTSVDVHTWLSSSSSATRSTRTLMQECVYVAQALAIPDIDETLVDELINRMLGFDGPVWTSMYHDMKARRAMEVDVILGGILEKGREKGISTPTLEVLYALTRAVDQRLAKERTEVASSSNT